jgi:hypothetical protein
LIEVSLQVRRELRRRHGAPVGLDEGEREKAENQGRMVGGEQAPSGVGALQAAEGVVIHDAPVYLYPFRTFLPACFKNFEISEMSLLI